MQFLISIIMFLTAEWLMSIAYFYMVVRLYYYAMPVINC